MKKTYADRIKAIARERNISQESAKVFYRTVVKNDKYRIERLVMKDARNKPKWVSKKQFDKLAKKVSKGKEKGKFIMYVDKVLQKPVDAFYALRMRRELMINRFSIWLQNIVKSRQRQFVKYWPKKALQRKKPAFLTEYEAKLVAKKIVKDFYKDDNVLNAVRKVFYYG